MRVPGHPRIDIDPNICFGKPRVAGTRLRVSDVLGQLGAGTSLDELYEDYPPLTWDDVQACLAYAADRMDQRIDLAAAE
jgi:uncharacterized protein (DUF433 family)